MSDLEARRRFLAEELAVCGNLQTERLIEALATVPREQFLPPGPWLLRGEADFRDGPRSTPDADPKHVYHNVAIAIDASRQLFNGAPAVVASAIDALALQAGSRVLHLGCGLGYYTALIAHTVGPSGHVVALEVDADLACEARSRLAAYPWVEVQHGNGTGPVEAGLDAILINAGVTHPRDSWLDAVVDGGRIVLPLTATFPQMGPIGKGFMLRFTRLGNGDFAIHLVNMVAIYSAIDLRDDALNAALGTTLMRAPFPPPGMRLRRDAHEPSEACWLHGESFCIASGPGRPSPVNQSP
jgi:protein-L-isoaspartate(D-aspartate) O-methyltransferase